MGQKIFLIFVLTVLTGFHCIPSGGHHGHDGGHQHGTHDNENPGEGNQIDLSGIFNELGIKVLGKDQESADEKSPVQDHSQINFKAVISEILNPSTFSPPVSTTTKPISSTQKLPIKSHREGWFESPVALVLNNQVLEPVYDQEISSSTPRTVYLTETPYFKSSQSTTQFKPLTDTFQRRSADIDLMTGNLENLLTNKKLMPVVNTRWANYRVANRRGRSHKVGIGSTRVRNKENQVRKDGRRFEETLSSSPRVSNLQKSSRRSKSSKETLRSMSILQPPLINHQNMFSSNSLLLSSPVQNSPSPLILPPISDHHDPSHDVPSRSKTRPRAGLTHQIITRPGAQDLHQQHEMDQEKWLAIPGMKRITPTTDLEDSRTTPTTGLEDSRTTPTTGLEDLINEVFTNPSKHNSQGSQQHSKVQQQIHENALRQQHRRKEKSFGAHQLVELVHQDLEDHAEPQIGLPSRFLQKEFYMEINGDDDLDEGDIKKIDGLDLHTVKDIVENNLWRWDADEGHEQIFEKHKKDCSQAHIVDSNADQPVHKDVPHGHQPVHMAAPHGHMVAPHGHMVSPHGHMVAPHGDMVAPHEHMVAPHGDMVAAHGHIVAPQGHMVAPHGHMVETHGHMVAPQGHMVAPNGDMIAPHRHMVAPHGHMVATHGDMVAPLGHIVAPHGHKVETHGHMVAPHGDMDAPHLDINKSVVKNEPLALVRATHQHEESLNPKPLNTRGGREEKMTRVPEVSGVRSLQPSPPRQVKESEHFNCIGRAPRLYADVEAGCKRFLLCHESGRMGKFNCPVGTLFNEPLQICDWMYKVTC